MKATTTGIGDAWRRAFAAWLVLASTLAAHQVVDASIEDARRALLAGVAERAELSLHASVLIDSRDLTTLSEVLDLGRAGESKEAALATLSALRVRGEPGLLSSLVRLAAAGEDADVTTSARETVVALARTHGEVVARLRAWSVDGSMRSGAERALCIEVLGASRDLSAVPDLIGLVDTPLGDQAHEALVALTGHDAIAVPSADAWRAHWTPRARLTREELLETEIERLRTAPQQAFAELERQLQQTIESQADEIVEVTLELIGVDVGRLIDALAHRNRAIRLEAARRLRDLPGQAGAEAAVPALVARLVGRPSGEDVAGTNGPDDIVTAPAVVERDAEVRAMVVEALGKVGRLEEGVADVLLGELRAPQAAVASSAVRALKYQKNRPNVVEPLLTAIDRGTFPDELLVTALETVAANEPGESVLPRISRWLDEEQQRPVREAAVLVALATPAVGAALDVIDLTDPDKGVRYRIARGLGDAVRDLEQDDPVHLAVGEALEVLLRDDDLNVRAEAASALGAWGGASALDWLAERSRRETEASVLNKIVAALGSLGRLEAVDHIGRVCSQQTNGDQAAILETAQDALETIGADVGADEWLAMGRGLSTVKAYDLAAWVLAEMPRRFGASPEYGVVLEEAKGLSAEVLYDDQRYEEARTALRELHEDDAPLPAYDRRLFLLARTNEFLGDHAAAAGYDLELFTRTSAGDVERFGIQRDLVRTLIKSGQPREAQVYLDELIAEAEARGDPVLVELLFVRGDILAMLEQREALATLVDRLDEMVGSDGERERLDLLRAQVAEDGAAAGAAPAGDDPNDPDDSPRTP